MKDFAGRFLSLGLSFSLVLSGCGARQPNGKTDLKHRSLASVETSMTKGSSKATQAKAAGKKSLDMAEFPETAKKFILNQPQRVKLEKDLKTYSKILPKDIYQRLVKLSYTVDDIGFEVRRKGDHMILNNGKHTLKVGFSGATNQILMSFEGVQYDFSKPQALNDLVTLMEQASAHSKVGQVNVGPNPFFNLCVELLGLSSAQALDASDWFFIGGMAILAIGIGFAAYTLGKSVKKTEHKVSGTVSLDEGSQATLNNLSNAFQNGNIDVNSNLDVNVGIK